MSLRQRQANSSNTINTVKGNDDSTIRVFGMRKVQVRQRQRQRQQHKSSKIRVMSWVTMLLGCGGVVAFLNLGRLGYLYSFFIPTTLPLSFLDSDKEAQKMTTTYSKPAMYDSKNCPKFGCPIYPAELTPYLDSLLQDRMLFLRSHIIGGTATVTANSNSNSNSNSTATTSTTIKAEAKAKAKAMPFTDRALFDFAGPYYALLTQKGASHYVNQDRAVLINHFYQQKLQDMIISTDAEDETTTKTTMVAGAASSSFLLAIFDGHGREGHLVANYLVLDFPERLAAELDDSFALSSKGNVLDDRTIIQALNKTVVEMDVYGPPNMLRGGSTATITLRLGSKLYIANTGDSQTMVASLPTAQSLGRPVTMEDAAIEYTTRKDKATIPEEYERISSLNGTIHVNPNGYDSRVVVYSVTARESIALAMSRSLGDWEWKPVGVTAEPIIDVVDLTNISNPVVIAASDGFFDVRRNQFYAKQFSKAIDVDPLQRLWDVFKMITPKGQKGYRDDMSAIIMHVQ